MFDVARFVALSWALVVVVRARAWLELVALAVVAYFFALAVVSGFTIRNEGPLEPMLALMLALIGPTSIPRGRLPSLPGAHLVVAWPALVSSLACVVLVVRARRIGVRAEALPASSPKTRSLDRLGRSLVLIAAFEGISAATRVLPYVLDRGWGGGDSIFEEGSGRAPR